jgi:hypothetical protein
MAARTKARGLKVRAAWPDKKTRRTLLRAGKTTGRAAGIVGKKAVSTIGKGASAVGKGIKSLIAPTIGITTILCVAGIVAILVLKK